MKLGFTGTAKSGEEKSAEVKKGDKEILTVRTQGVPEVVIAQKLTSTY